MQETWSSLTLAVSGFGKQVIIHQQLYDQHPDCHGRCPFDNVETHSGQCATPRLDKKYSENIDVGLQTCISFSRQEVAEKMKSIHN